MRDRKIWTAEEIQNMTMEEYAVHRHELLALTRNAMTSGNPFETSVFWKELIAEEDDEDERLRLREVLMAAQAGEEVSDGEDEAVDTE